MNIPSDKPDSSLIVIVKRDRSLSVSNGHSREEVAAYIEANLQATIDRITAAVADLGLSQDFDVRSVLKSLSIFVCRATPQVREIIEADEGVISVRDNGVVYATDCTAGAAE